MKKRIIIIILIAAILLISTGCCAKQQFGPSFAEEAKANKGMQWYFGFNATMKPIVTAPLHLNGKYYVTSLGGNLFCLDDERGQKIEAFKFNEGRKLKGGFRSKVVTDGENIYVGNFDHNLYCLNPDTGAVVWIVVTNDKIEGAPVLADGKVYIGNWEGRIYCFDTESGEENWYFDVASKIRCTPGYYAGNLYFGDDSGTFYCLSAGDKPGVVWKSDNVGEVYGEPVTDGTYVWLASLDGNIYCLDATDGSQVWVKKTGAEIWAGPHIDRFTIPLKPVQPPVEEIVGDDGLTSTLDATTETDGETVQVVDAPGETVTWLYIGSMDAHFYILNALTGEKASYVDPASGFREEISPIKVGEGIKFDGGIRGTAVTDDTQVYFGAGDFGFRALDKVTGDLNWTFVTRGQVWGKPLVQKEIVVFGCEDTYFYGLKTQSGNPVKGAMV